MIRSFPIVCPIGCPNCRLPVSSCTTPKVADIENDNICSICLNLSYELPVVTKCGHFFCFNCINGYAIHKKHMKTGNLINRECRMMQMIRYLKECYIASSLLMEFYFHAMESMEIFNSSEYFNVAFSMSNVCLILRITEEFEERVLPIWDIAINDLDACVSTVYNAINLDSFDTIDLAKFIVDNVSMVIYALDRYRYVFNCLENEAEFNDSIISLQKSVDDLLQLVIYC